jgi:secreted trypsin-like serine protease
VFAGKLRRTVSVAVATLGCCLAVAGGASAGSGPSERIVGGDVADPADWPFIAAVTSRRGDQFCGGSVVAEDAVVTAAHCMFDFFGNRLEPRQVRVVTGRPDLREGSTGQEIRVAEITVHREYRRKGHRDVAVLNLRDPTPATPILLPTVAEEEEETAPGQELRVAGWGGTTPTGRNPSDVLLDVAVFPISDKACAPHFPWFRPAEEVCAFGESQGGNKYDDSCYGDSGGPLVADSSRGALLVGIVSYGGTRCGVEEPGVYAQVGPNLSFIERKAGL